MKCRFTSCLLLLAGILADFAQAQPTLRKEISPEQQALVSAAVKLNDRAIELYGQGKYREAIPLVTQVLAVREPVLGEDDPETTGSLTFLGILYFAAGDYAGSRPYHERALKIRKKNLGEEHLDTAASFNNLGLSLYRLEDYKAARPNLEQALKIRKQVLAPEHVDTAATHNNLGELLTWMGDFEAARRHLDEALLIRQKLLGKEHPDTATSLSNLGYLLHVQKDYALARANYEQVLKIRTKVLGEDHPNTLAVLERLGSTLYVQGDYAAARPIYERVLKNKQKALGENHVSTVGYLSVLGNTLFAQREYAAARSYFEQAIRIQKQVNGDNHADTATLLNSLGATLEWMGNYESARTYYEQAFTIRKKVLGEEHLDTAISQYNLGYLLFWTGEYAAARPHLEQVVQIRTKLLGAEHPETATALDRLGQVLYWLEDYAAARPRLEAALLVRKKVLGEVHADTAEVLRNLGSLLYWTGDYADARIYLEQSLQIRKKVLGEDHRDTGATFDSLGQVLEAQREYAAARAAYDQALRIRKKLLLEDHPDTASLLIRLGRALQRIGDFGAARPCIEQSLRIRMKTRGADHWETAESLNDLGYLLYWMGDYTAAKPFLEQALQVRKKVIPEHRDTATTLHNLGNLSVWMRDYPAALPYFEQALQIRQKVYGEEHWATADTLRGLGGVSHARADYQGARQYYERALQIERKVFGEDHPQTAVSLSSLGSLLYAQGDLAAARPYFEQALKLQLASGANDWNIGNSFDTLLTLEAKLGNIKVAAELADRARRKSLQHIARVLPGLSDNERFVFLKTYEFDRLQKALSLALTQPANAYLAAQSAVWLINGKTIGQEALAARARMAHESSNPQLTKTAQALTNVRRKLAGLALASAKQGQEAARSAELDRLTAEELRLSRELATASGKSSEAGDWVELDALRKAIPADAVLIDIARVHSFYFQPQGQAQGWQPPRYAAWVIPPAGKGEIQIVDLGFADLVDSAVHDLRNEVQKSSAADGALQKSGESDAEKRLQSHLRELAQQVWTPLTRHLGNAKQVVLSPDGALWLVPWGALLTGPQEQEQYLIEKFGLRLVNSGRDLVQPATAALPTTRPALFADPDFDLSPDAAQAATKAVLPDLKADDDQTRGFAATKTALPRVLRLPNTAVEAQAAGPSIGRYVGSEPLAYTERYALESVVKRVQRPKLLLFATHGFFLPDQEVKRDEQQLPGSESSPPALLTVEGKPIENPLLRCGLLLAGCNTLHTSGGDDGVLTGMEIVGLDLRGTELVVLSACETGIGKIRNGEGVAGLRQAFQLAGAKAVVSTLWQVPDRDSALIMNDFFANLATGQSKPEALRNAQLKRMASRRDKYGAAHPFYWAAWTVTGN